MQANRVLSLSCYGVPVRGACIFCDMSSITSLAVNRQSRYLLLVPANSGAGIDLRIYFVGDILTRLRLFLCRTHGYTSMVGWAGALQGAPVANKAGKVNSVQFHHPRD